MSKKDVSNSKFLSLVLRHQPETIGVSLDPNGWIDVEVLLGAMAQHGRTLSREDLERLVRESDKQRFALSEDGKRIRANQGHSVEVDLALAPQTPPEILYHGTVDRFLDSILSTGLRKGERHHVHLSANLETAEKVGQRRGQPVILEIRSGDMHRAGVPFFLSDNGVWLVDHVPTEFIVHKEAPTVPRALGQQGLTTLFRPTGLNELKLIHGSGMKTWPPRLPGQPIFYPVMNQEYAQQIARDWNAKSEPARIGFVLRFDVESAYVAKFPIQKVGGKKHLELWVPAEELEEFNRHIVGQLEIIDVFRGPECNVDLDERRRIPKTWLT
jgi:putative RNA 2'-phosphotransferase